MTGALPNCLICGAELVYATQSYEVTCEFCAGNKQCLRMECPYFPGNTPGNAKHPNESEE